MSQAAEAEACGKVQSQGETLPLLGFHVLCLRESIGLRSGASLSPHQEAPCGPDPSRMLRNQ